MRGAKVYTPFRPNKKDKNFFSPKIAHVMFPPVQTVDAKKLEKAEAKLRAKHERRNEKDLQKPSNPL